MQLIGKKRKLFGKKIKYLRADRKLPAVIFGPKMESVSIETDYNDFIKTYKESGETQVVEITIGKKVYPTLIKEMQLDPISSKVIHVGFHKIDLTQKTTANIPVEIINEEKNTLVKNGEALILVLLNEIEVEALPQDLPEKFEIDASVLENTDSTITIADLKYDKTKVEIVGIEQDEIVAKLDYAQMLEEEEEEEEKSEEEMIADVEATEEKPENEDEDREKTNT